jgi:hypothetical protein
VISESVHIFNEHLLQKQSAGAIINPAEDLIWPSIFLFICLILLSFIKAASIEKVLRIIQSTFNKQVLQQLEREEANQFRLYSLALTVFFLLNLSFLIYKINSIYQFILVEYADLTQFVFFFVVLSLSHFIKSILNRLIAFFTNEEKIISEYVSRSAIINHTFGVFLFPLIILLEFSPFSTSTFISLAVLLLALSLILKWYRGLIRSLIDERIGLLQIFTYFCGLEILPAFVLVKFVIETF